VGRRGEIDCHEMPAFFGISGSVDEISPKKGRGAVEQTPANDNAAHWPRFDF